MKFLDNLILYGALFLAVLFFFVSRFELFSFASGCFLTLFLAILVWRFIEFKLEKSVESFFNQPLENNKEVKEKGVVVVDPKKVVGPTSENEGEFLNGTRLE